MAYSNNLDAIIDQWLLYPPFSSDAAGQPWLSSSPSDAVIAQALALSANSSISLPDIPTPVPSPTPETPRSFSGSGSDFGSDRETNSRTVPGAVTGRIGKRKPRPSKKSPTTFITADAANFRQMVQDVTGVQIPSETRLPAVVKPEPQRFAGGAGGGNGLIYTCLPTLDTSAFLIDRHNRQQALVAQSLAAPSRSPAAENGCSGFAFDGFSCFPTLESGKVM